MTTHIVAARLPSQQAADEALQALQQRGIAADRIEVFNVTDAGRHGRFEIGGDRDADPATQDSAKGAGKGALAGAAAGAAAGTVAAAAAPLVAPAIIAGAAGAGAFAGALAGAMRETDPRPAPQREATAEGRDDAAALGSTRRGGLMLAVDVGDGAAESMVVDCLRAAGGESVERAQGQWHDGRWVDFDPTLPLQLVDAPPR